MIDYTNLTENEKQKIVKEYKKKYKMHWWMKLTVLKQEPSLLIIIHLSWGSPALS